MLHASRVRHLRALMVAVVLFFGLSGRALALDSEPHYDEAQAVCVTDTYGNVLYGNNEMEELPPASLTKVVTAMVAIDSGIPLDTPIDFIVNDFQEGAQLAGYVDGDTPTFGELLRVMLIYSGNDAAFNIAHAVSGSIDGFCDLMNDKVAELGLEHTHFANPHGLEEEGHYSCAHDMCVIGRYALEHYPLIRATVKTPSITIVADGHETTLWTTDELMDLYEGLIGIKTGKTEHGASFLGAARRYHVTLYSCVLCCDSYEGRNNDTMSLLDWGFAQYDMRTLSHRDWTLRTAPWQDGFWLRCPVNAERDMTGGVFSEGSLSCKKSMFRPSTFVGIGSVYGTSLWNQDGRSVGGVTYRTGSTGIADSAWNPIEAPLFKSY